jgi:hypothetical protein
MARGERGTKVKYQFMNRHLHLFSDYLVHSERELTWDLLGTVFLR